VGRPQDMPLTRAQQEHADVVDRVRIRELKIGVRLIDLGQACLQKASCDHTAEHACRIANSQTIRSKVIGL
jgi:hypothetical protein